MNKLKRGTMGTRDQPKNRVRVKFFVPPANFVSTEISNRVNTIFPIHIAHTRGERKNGDYNSTLKGHKGS
jgi:hypothetical protein